MNIPRRHELGLLLSKDTRTRLVLVVLGAITVAVIEIVALASVLPLMQLLGGRMPTLGPLGSADEVLGMGRKGVAVTLAALIFGAYLAKGVIGIAYRWWVGGFLARQQVDASARLLSYYLTADYSLHLRRSLADFVRRLNEAVTQTYSGVIMNSVTLVTESLTVVAILAALLWAQPLPALGMLLFFGIAATALYLGTRGPAAAAGRRQLEAAGWVFRRSIEPIHNIKDVQLRGNQETFVEGYSAADGMQPWLDASPGS